MSGFDYYGGGAKEMTTEQLNALDEVHGKMTHDIADAHLTVIACDTDPYAKSPGDPKQEASYGFAGEIHRFRGTRDVG